MYVLALAAIVLASCSRVPPGWEELGAKKVPVHKLTGLSCPADLDGQLVRTEFGVLDGDPDTATCTLTTSTSYQVRIVIVGSKRVDSQEIDNALRAFEQDQRRQGLVPTKPARDVYSSGSGFVSWFAERSTVAALARKECPSGARIAAAAVANFNGWLTRLEIDSPCHPTEMGRWFASVDRIVADHLIATLYKRSAGR